MSNDFAPDYIDVAERIRQLRDKHPDASLQGSYELVDVNGTTHVVYRAECFRTADDVRPGVGYAWEQVPGRTPYTKTSELMNAETSAWGRAIVAALAADTKRVASQDEMANTPAYASAAAKTQIAAAMRTLPTEVRASVAAELRELYGPSHLLLEANIADVLNHIENAEADAAPFDAETHTSSAPPEASTTAERTVEGDVVDAEEDEGVSAGTPSSPTNGKTVPCEDLRVPNIRTTHEALTHPS